jgi:hypothetical protein
MNFIDVLNSSICWDRFMPQSAQQKYSGLTPFVSASALRIFGYKLAWLWRLKDCVDGEWKQILKDKRL